MSILKTLEQTSFKTLAGLSLLLVLLIGLPIVVWISLQKTQLSSSAYFEKPKVIIPAKNYGAASRNDPVISLVWPFLGKVGDAVLIEGDNFGNNPLNKQLTINGLPVPEENINKWTVELIEFVIPAQAASGLIKFTVEGKEASWPYLFTIYSKDTKTQVTENNDVVRVINALPGSKAEVFFSNGDKLESDELTGFNIPGDKTVISVIVRDPKANPLPFFVEPEEFGF